MNHPSLPYLKLFPPNPIMSDIKDAILLYCLCFPGKLLPVFSILSVWFSIQPITLLPLSASSGPRKLSPPAHAPAPVSLNRALLVCLRCAAGDISLQLALSVPHCTLVWGCTSPSFFKEGADVSSLCSPSAVACCVREKEDNARYALPLYN